MTHSVGVHNRRERKLFRRIENASRRGSIEQSRSAIWVYLSAFSPRACAAEKALKRSRRGKRGQPIEWAEIEQLARSLNVRRDSGEPVRISWKQKSSGGWRPICAFGVRERAIQYLIKSALEAAGCGRPEQYNLPGRSKDQLIKKAADWMEGGFEWAVLLDIKDCFGSLATEGLKECLPLPRATTERHIAFGHLRLRHHRRNRRRYTRKIVPIPAQSSPSSIGRTGIPQGSAVSSLVAAHALSDLFDLIPDGSPFGQFGDDIVVFARTRSEACTILKALEDALSKHPCGPIGLRRKEIASCREGFEFLGYFLWKVEERAMVRPSDRNREKFWRRLIAALNADYNAGRNAPQVAEEVLDRWLSGSPYLRDSTNFRMLALNELSSRLLLAQGAGSRRYLRHFAW
jgi:hypothetical protein